MGAIGIASVIDDFVDTFIRLRIDGGLSLVRSTVTMFLKEHRRLFREALWGSWSILDRFEGGVEISSSSMDKLHWRWHGQLAYSLCYVEIVKRRARAQDATLSCPSRIEWIGTVQVLKGGWFWIPGTEISHMYRDRNRYELVPWIALPYLGKVRPQYSSIFFAIECRWTKQLFSTFLCSSLVLKQHIPMS